MGGGAVPVAAATASPAYDASSGTMGVSGLTMTPSPRTECSRFAALTLPSGSPTPTMPAESVDMSRLSASPLMNTSLHGHTPTSVASCDVYRNASQLAG